MASEKGRQQYFAIKKEGTRGTPETTGFAFYPWARLQSKNENSYRDKNSSYAARGALLGQDLVMQHGMLTYGDFLDADTHLNEILEGIFGSASASTADGTTTTNYTVNQNIEAPTFTVQYDTGQTGEKMQNGVTFKNLKLKITKDNAEFDAEAFGIKEQAGASLSPSVAKPARPFLGRHLSIGYADTLAGLSSATDITSVQTVDIEFDTGVDPQMLQVMNGEIHPDDIVQDGFTAKLEFEMVVRESLASTIQGWHDAGTEKAFRVVLEADNQAVIGASALKPKLTFNFPPSQIKVERVLELDELIKLKVSIDIAQADLTTCELINTA